MMKMLKTHSSLAADPENPLVLVQYSNDAHVNVELLGKQIEDIIHYGLQVGTTRDYLGCFVQYSQLFPSSLSAKGNRTENIENIFHLAVPSGQIIFDYHSCRGSSERSAAWMSY